MRIVYMGTPEYARIVLEKLLESDNEVVLAVTGEDAKSKRGNKLIPCPVKAYAEEQGIEVITPKTLRDADVQAKIADAKPDVICVAAYGKILPKEVLEMPIKGCLNVHASLLPRWRGAAPIERAILEGDIVQGVCIMKMEEGLDTGDFYTCGLLNPLDKTQKEITEQLAALGGETLVYVLDRIDKVTWEAQEEPQVTYANKIEKGELNLDPADGVSKNLAKVNASSDSHPCKCIVAGKTVRILQAEKDLNLMNPIINGWVVKDEYKGAHVVGDCFALDGLKILRLKPDGKNEMDAKSFIAGCKELRDGTATWEKC